MRLPQYGAEHEKEFLNGIGSYYTGSFGRDRNETKIERRHRLLKQYLQSMDGRVNWGSISKHGIKDYVENLIFHSAGDVLKELRAERR